MCVCEKHMKRDVCQHNKLYDNNICQHISAAKCLVLTRLARRLLQ